MRQTATSGDETGSVHAFAAAGGGFLLAVLWFDLMFDVQVARAPTGAAADDALASISAYYRRVTTDARPMNRLVAAMMLATLAAVAVQLGAGTDPAWVAWASLVLAAAPVGLAAGRTVGNAVRLGGRADPVEVQAALARRIYRDHLACVTSIALFVAVQLFAAV